jgi:spermidine synthase
MDTDSDTWLEDTINANFKQRHHLEEVLYEGWTGFQNVRIVRSTLLGMCLVLDGKIQSSEVDEFIYHEGLVQPAMLACPRPETVFIAGGGEGATLREVLRHDTVRKAVLVDIDEQVTALSRRYLPGHAAGAFDDPRAEVHHEDARAFLERSGETYDVIIIDLPDPMEEGPAYRLFTQEFYNIVTERLTGQGIIAVQAGSTALTELRNFTAVHHTLASVFPFVRGGTVNVPCFGVPWGFCLASHRIDVAALTAAEVDKRIAARGLGGLKFYDGITHAGMFNLPKYVREAAAGQERLITDDTPLYFLEK